MTLYEAKCEVLKVGNSNVTSSDEPMLQYNPYNSDYIILHLDVTFLGIVVFKTPGFVDGAEYIKFTIPVNHCKKQTLRCAIATSDTNHAKYYKVKTPTVSDENQIVTTTIEMPYHDKNEATGIMTKNMTYSIAVDSLEPNKTYYLFLWAESGLNPNENNPEYDDIYLHVGSALKHTVSVYCRVGLLNIDSGSGFETYQGYIDNGTSWDMVVPYVDNGSDWDMYT